MKNKILILAMLTLTLTFAAGVGAGAVAHADDQYDRTQIDTNSEARGGMGYCQGDSKSAMSFDAYGNPVHSGGNAGGGA
jgi:hypothetical protein